MPTTSSAGQRLIIVVPERGGTVTYNYATNAAIDYPPLVERVLRAGNDWVTPERLARAAGANRKATAACMLSLLEYGFLVVKGTIAGKRDVEYQTRWDRDVRAGLFHLAVRNPLLQTEEEAGEALAEQIAVGPKIRLFETNESYAHVTQLAQPDPDGPDVLSRRRTRRKFAGASISLRTLADCLYARSPLPRPSELLGWQKWTDRAAAVVFLVANYDRTMWKYPHPMADRAVLIEAGQIAQTRHGSRKPIAQRDPKCS